MQQFLKRLYLKRKQKSRQCQNCQHREEGCWFIDDSEKCVRFLPECRTNLTEIDGIIETPPNVDSDTFLQMFSNWLDSMGWLFCGITAPYDEEKHKER